MISVTIFNSKDQFKGFEFDGHAGFDTYGKDIICSAVSVLVINTINSIEQFTTDGFSVESDSKRGFIKVDFTEDNSSDVKLLIKSMILGLEEIEKKYGSKYLKLHYKEV